MAKKTAFKQGSLEKLLRYMLGIRPDEFGLQPDGEGFVALKELLAALRDEDAWRGVREGQIAMLANQPGGQSPFEIREALVRLKPALASLPPEAPGPEALPKLLYLPLKPSAWPVIHDKGVFPKIGHSQVRLWADEELAKKIGRRLSPAPVLVCIRAMAARQESGAVFSPYSELLWLTAEVPARFLSGPPVVAKEEEAPVKRAKEAPDPAGSFYLQVSADPQVQVHKGKKKGKYDDSPDWKNQIRRDRRRG